MSKPSAPVLDRVSAVGCACFADHPPLPMGCAVCGHAPYAHGCPGQRSDHEYAQPSDALMRIRLEERRRTGTHRLPDVRPPADVAPAESVPLVPAQRRPEPPAPAVPAVRPPLPRQVPRPGTRPTVSRSSRRDHGRRPMPKGVRGPDGARAAPPVSWPSVADGAPRSLFPRRTGRTRPAPYTSGRVLDRKKVRSMEDARSATPEPAIPGWRVIVSDRKRLWASRIVPFTDAEMWSGATRTVDADTFGELADEVERQERAARREVS